ncbi:MAG: hypothetical protein ACE5JX_22130, partial [Acidobacteriota bacterium]
ASDASRRNLVHNPGLAGGRVFGADPVGHAGVLGAETGAILHSGIDILGIGSPPVQIDSDGESDSDTDSDEDVAPRRRCC